MIIFYVTSSSLFKSNDNYIYEIEYKKTEPNRTEDSGVQILQIIKPTDEGSEQCLNRQVYL